MVKIENIKINKAVTQYFFMVFFLIKKELMKETFFDLELMYVSVMAI